VYRKSSGMGEDIFALTTVVLRISIAETTNDRLWIKKPLTLKELYPPWLV